MKNLLVLLTFLLCTNFSIAQKQITTWDGEVYRNMTISLKDGSTLVGYGKVLFIAFDAFISFKRTKDEGGTLYAFEDIINLKTTVGNKECLFEYKTLIASPEGKWLKLIEVIVDGKLMIYQGYFDSTSTDAKRTYYISKKGDDVVRSLKSGDTYSSYVTNKILYYTKSCSTLTKKLKTKYFKRYGIKDIANFYNNECSSKR